MAHIQERKNKQGRITSYRVMWRDKKGIQRTQSLEDLESAQKWKTLLEQVDHDTKAAEQALVRSNSEKPPLYTVCDEHIQRLIVRPYTTQKYRGYIKNHLSPIGNLPVDTITDTDMIQWVKYMQSKKLSAKTILNVHGFIYSTMETAIRLKYREDNPCDGKYLPDDDATEDTSTFLTMQEFTTILEYVPGHNKLAFQFLISTGLRLGEMTALTVEDALLDANVPSVRVVKSYQEEHGQWVVGPPKTPESRRTVSLPPSLTAQLEQHVKGKHPDDSLFTSRDGSTSAAHRTWQRTWNAAVKTARDKGEVRKSPRIHDLRHSHASLMIEAGMNLFDLAKRLGHKSVTTTTTVYGHLMPGAHFKAANLMENILSSKPSQQLA